MLAPVLPWLTDDSEHLERALASLAEAGATGVMVLPLHLRPGAKEWFFTWLGRERPDLLKRYEAMYGRSANAPASYRRSLSTRVQPLLERYGFARPGARIREPDDRDFPHGSLPVLDARPAPPPADQLSLL
jgi:DNA repair photolyase